MRSPPLLALALFLLSAPATHAESPPRDPFWPLGYTPGPRTPDTPAQAPEVVEPEATVLSDEELRELAREEARNIQASLDARGRMVVGERTYGYVEGRWLTVGDSFTKNVQGREYRLLITRLTSTEIDLEPYRIPTP